MTSFSFLNVAAMALATAFTALSKSVADDDVADRIRPVMT